MQVTKKHQQFQLFQTPVDLAHLYWQKLLNRGDLVIDATCGNGYDTLFLANLVLNEKGEGKVFGFDKQQQAIENTQNLLKDTFSNLKHISLYLQCHSSFPADIINESISLIVYNLGYLPGGDKDLTTMSATSLQSFKAALPLIKAGGAISIMCYTGHEAGKPEEQTALDFSTTLDPKEWSCCYHRWINRKNAPSLILIQRAA